MSHNGRAQVASVTDQAGQELAGHQDGVCAAGTFAPRLVGIRKSVTLDAEQRRGLIDLVDAGKMLRRSDCYHSATTGMTVSLPVARRLKSLDLAVAGFAQEMCPSQRGIRIAKEIAEETNAATG